MSSLRKKRIVADIATVRKEDISKGNRPCAKMTLHIPQFGSKVSKTAHFDNASVTSQVKCCSNKETTRAPPKTNKILIDKGTQASGTWHQMLCKDTAYASPGRPKLNNRCHVDKIASNKDVGKIMTVLKQLFKNLLDSFEGKKTNEEPLRTLKETEMMVYAMASECDYDLMDYQKNAAFAENFWSTVFSELSRKKVNNLLRKISLLEEEKDLAQKNVKILKRQLENGKQVIMRSIDEKAKSEALQAEMKSVLNHMPSKQDVNNLKSAKLRIEQELDLKQAELNSLTDLLAKIKTEMESLKNENRDLKVKEDRLEVALSAYKDGFQALKTSLIDKIKDLETKNCRSSPTCSTFIESPIISPFRGSTSTIRDPNVSNSSSSLSSNPGDPRPVTFNSLIGESFLMKDLDDKKHSTSIPDSTPKRLPTFSLVKNDCHAFFGSLIPQAVALADGANNLDALVDNTVISMTHLTESSSIDETGTTLSDILR